MCKPFSCIVTKGKKALTSNDLNIHYHEETIKNHHLKDDCVINRSWIRIEVRPTTSDYVFNVDTGGKKEHYQSHRDYTSNVNNWEVKIDEKSTLPEWFTLDKELYEIVCKNAAKKWQRKCVDKFGRYIVNNVLSHATEWFINGKYHRVNGPACEYTDGTKLWYYDGELHRTGGPAIQRPDGSNSWYRYGYRVG